MTKDNIDKILEMCHRVRQDRTLLIYNMVEMSKDRKEILEWLHTELQELGVFEK